MLSKIMAMNMIKSYLNNNCIEYELVHESKSPVLLDNIDCVVIPCHAELVIGRWIEVTLRFRERHLYLMAYYNQVFCTPDKYSCIARFLNHVNAKLHYETIFEHKMILDEETGDIYNGVMIRYESLKNSFGDVMDYIVCFQKQLLEDIGIPLVMLQCEKWSFIKSKEYIDEKIKNTY